MMMDDDDAIQEEKKRTREDDTILPCGSFTSRFADGRCPSVGCERLGVPVWHSRDENIAGWRRDSSVAGAEGRRKVRPSV